MNLIPRPLVVLGLLLTLLQPSAAIAHRFAPSLLKITEISDRLYNVVWKTPIEAVSDLPLQPSWPSSCAVKTANPVLREGTGSISSWVLDCTALGGEGLIGQALGVIGLAENRTSAMVILNLGDGRSYQSVLNAEKSVFTVPAQPSGSKIMTEYAVLGAEHIWAGIDHLMFVFGLLLLVGVGVRLLWTITAFTVGHSITLALVTLGFLTYPVSLVEFTIALSIFVLALALTRSEPSSDQPTSLLKRHPWWLAGGFGLLHGMGFAGALADIGLPQSNVPLALLFFNVGIEVGQIGFVLLLLGSSWLINQALTMERLTVKPKRLRVIPVYLLGGLSSMWCIERGLELVS